MRKQKKPWTFKPCTYLQNGTKCDSPSVGISCTDCLLARIYLKLDSGGELQKKALETSIEFIKFCMKEIKKERKKA